MYSYTRIDHFNTIINNINKYNENNQNIELSQTDYYLILNKLNGNTTNYEELKQILKELNLRKYYEYIPYLINKINDTEQKIIDKYDIIKIKNKFKEFSDAFNIIKNSHEINLPNYHFLLFMICKDLGLNKYCKLFSTPNLPKYDIWNEVNKYIQFNKIRNSQHY
jgi:hypothetical protein